MIEWHFPGLVSQKAGKVPQIISPVLLRATAPTHPTSKDGPCQERSVTVELSLR